MDALKTFRFPEVSAFDQIQKCSVFTGETCEASLVRFADGTLALHLVMPSAIDGEHRMSLITETPVLWYQRAKRQNPHGSEVA